MAPINTSEDGDNRTFALHSAAARISSLTPHSPILQLRKLRFMEMKPFVQGHTALVGSDHWPMLFTPALCCLSDGSISPSSVCSASYCLFNSNPPFYLIALPLSQASPTHTSVPTLDPSLVSCPSLAPFSASYLPLGG